MWSYYGSKTNLVSMYPKPKHNLIIEPFAGSAKYSLRYFEKDVLLIDKYDVIIKIWKYLQKCSVKDILSLPRRFKESDRLTDFKWDCEEQLLLMGFIVGCGAERPRNKLVKRKTTDRPNHINYNIQRIAKNLFKIRHWKFLHADYLAAPDKEATWFIDPPYEFGGSAYVENNKKINFQDLGTWAMDRKGQVIVCENTKASWMDFKPITKQRGSVHSTTEAIWTNEKTVYDNVQQQLFV